MRPNYSPHAEEDAGMLNDEESAKLALAEASKKISDLKARQWEISKNALLILAFLAAVFHGDSKYVLLHIPKRLQYLVLVLYIVYFGSIFLQTFSNLNRFKEIYKKAGGRLYSKAALQEYFSGSHRGMLEDEGRLQFFLFVIVVVAFLALTIVPMFAPGPPSSPSGLRHGLF
jgi:hypothetical protein